MTNPPQSQRELLMALIEKVVSQDISDPELLEKHLDVIDNFICELLDIDKSSNPSYSL
jgi:hypothetical protein